MTFRRKTNITVKHVKANKWKICSFWSFINILIYTPMFITYDSYCGLYKIGADVRFVYHWFIWLLLHWLHARSNLWIWLRCIARTIVLLYMLQSSLLNRRSEIIVRGGHIFRRIAAAPFWIHREWFLNLRVVAFWIGHHLQKQTTSKFRSG